MPWLPDLDMPDACNPSGKAEGFPTSQQKVSTWGRRGFVGGGALTLLSQCARALCCRCQLAAGEVTAAASKCPACHWEGLCAADMRGTRLCTTAAVDFAVIREVTACSSRVTAAHLGTARQLPVLQTSLLWVALAQHVGVTEPVAVPGCCWVGCWPLCCPALLTCMATPVVQ